MGAIPKPNFSSSPPHYVEILCLHPENPAAFLRHQVPSTLAQLPIGAVGELEMFFLGGSGGGLGGVFGFLGKKKFLTLKFAVLPSDSAERSGVRAGVSRTATREPFPAPPPPAPPR